jgi:hypothetical protein
MIHFNRYYSKMPWVVNNLFTSEGSGHNSNNI